eukprot:SM000014S00345  [mRNA]  locus=s14:826697:828744:+ [translate_table: standard]
MAATVGGPSATAAAAAGRVLAAVSTPAEHGGGRPAAARVSGLQSLRHAVTWVQWRPPSAAAAGAEERRGPDALQAAAAPAAGAGGSGGGGGGGGGTPALNDLPLVNYINQRGFVQPAVEPGTAATVFAVFDKNKKIQYIGFSKDVRNSLRTLLGRRPELCYFYKAADLPTLDQQQMIKIREQWISELGLPPTGNAEPAQRKLWEQPGDAGSISERGKVAAATSKAKTMLQILADRGLKEEFVYDPELLEKGLCDIQTSKEQSKEQLEETERQLSEAASRRREVAVGAPDGTEVKFEIFLQNKFKTNGGWMYDVKLSHDDKETTHRVVCGAIYPEAAGLPEDEFIERTFAFLLWKRLPRRTEGVLTGDQFGINYFSVSEVSQKFDDFRGWFASDLPDAYWRFNRLHSYGSQADPAPLLGPPPLSIEAARLS